MAARIRTFIAVDVGPAVRGAIGRELPKLTAVAPQINWTKSENYHFTLSFLGDVREQEIPEICKVIQESVKAIEEFELEIVGLTAFPSVDRIKYVWAGVGFGKEELCQLQATVADAASRLGFPRDRENYRPHLTIARATRNEADDCGNLNVLASFAECSFGVCSIDEVIVYASYQEKSGPSYVPMSTISLSY